jgi:NDP-sugar pyrophosphorylase family protein
MDCLVFSAGLGTRLKPITDTMPKALVPVGGKPLIEHVVRKLKSSGIENVVVNVHHFADMIEKWAAEQDIIPIRISDERGLLLETGGGVLHARSFLEGCGRFLLHNVDIISDLDLKWFTSMVKEGSMAMLLVSERKSNRYLLFAPESMRLVGWMNTATGEVKTPYEDLDPETCRKLAFSGIHILSDTVFGVMDDYVRERGLDADAARFPIVDFYLAVCAEHDICGVVAEDLHLVDVGKLDTLEIAEREISHLGNPDENN